MEMVSGATMYDAVTIARIALTAPGFKVVRPSGPARLDRWIWSRFFEQSLRRWHLR